LFIDNTVPPTVALLSAVYATYRQKHPADDGFLYITYSGGFLFLIFVMVKYIENTFGSIE
jgi:hypothetical protein